MATRPQKNFIRDLLAQKGYGTSIITRRHLPLTGAMDAWLGKPIDSWLDWLDVNSASILIDELKEMP